jgi:hypothetical protein
MAKRECPTLDAWEVEPDGVLRGLESEGTPSGAVLIAQLLGLMFTFIGESLTLRILQDAWPNLPYSEVGSERSTWTG